MSRNVKYQLYENCIPNLEALKKRGKGKETAQFVHTLIRCYVWKKSNPDLCFPKYSCMVFGSVRYGNVDVYIYSKSSMTVTSI